MVLRLVVSNNIARDRPSPATVSTALTSSPDPQSMGEEAASSGLGVSEFAERHRDTHDFARRVGQLPEQREGDRVDYRPLLHRDGSVLSAVTLEVQSLVGIYANLE